MEVGKHNIISRIISHPLGLYKRGQESGAFTSHNNGTLGVGVLRSLDSKRGGPTAIHLPPKMPHAVKILEDTAAAHHQMLLPHFHPGWCSPAVLSGPCAVALGDLEVLNTMPKGYLL